MAEKKIPTIRLKVPKGAESVSFGEHSWDPDKDGVIEVESKQLADHLIKDGGCTLAPDAPAAAAPKPATTGKTTAAAPAATGDGSGKPST